MQEKQNAFINRILIADICDFNSVNHFEFENWNVSFAPSQMEILLFDQANCEHVSDRIQRK